MKRLLLVATAGGVVLAYPLIWWLPATHSYRFEFPWLLVLLAVCMIALPIHGRRPVGPALVAMSAVLASVSGHVLVQMSVSQEAMHWAAWAIVPWAVGSMALAGGRLRLQLLKLLGWIFWLQLLMVLLLTVGAWLEWTSPRVAWMGLSGNRNWTAILLVALAPAGWLLVCRQRALVVVQALGLLVALLVLESRGAWLATVVVVCIVAAQSKVAAKGRRLLVPAIVCGALVVAWLVLSGTLAVAVARDVRLPLWTATGRLIADQPLGVGPDQFRKAITSYRAATGYGARAVAAAATDHPHLEVFHALVELGWLGGMAWVVLWWPVWLSLRSRRLPPFLAACGAVALFCGGLVDKPLTQAPTQLLAMVLLGLCWRAWLRARGVAASRPLLRAAALASAALLLVTSLFFILQAVQREWWSRQAAIALRHGQTREAAARLERALAVDRKDHLLLYRAVRLALMEDRLIEARQYLATLQQVEPDLAHTNYLMVRLLRAEGMSAADSLPWLVREAELHPYESPPWIELYSIYAQAGEWQSAEAVVNHLISAWRHKAELQHGPALPGLRAAWREAFCRQDLSAALELAGQLCGPDLAAGIDPLALLTQPGVSNEEGKGFSLDDADWWSVEQEPKRAFQAPAAYRWRNLHLLSLVRDEAVLPPSLYLQATTGDRSLREMAARVSKP